MLKFHSHLPKAHTILKIFITVRLFGKFHPEKKAEGLANDTTTGLAVFSVPSARTSEP